MPVRLVENGASNVEPGTSAPSVLITQRDDPSKLCRRGVDFWHILVVQKPKSE